MADAPYSTKRLLALRKLTRAIADLVRGELKEHLATLQPLFHPRTILGQYTDSAPKDAAGGAEKAFRDLQALYASVVAAKPFNLPKELKSPLEVVSAVPEITPVEYSHTAKADHDSKTITVTSPLKWVLSYSGFTPRRLKELLADRTRTGPELHEFVLHMLLTHLVLAKQPGIVRLLEGLRFPVTTCRRPETGDLPITYVSAAVPTVRPPDDVLIESTELSGKDVFEEVVDVDAIRKLPDPYRQRLVELVKGHGEELPGVDGP
jgi:hypothetical protein